MKIAPSPRIVSRTLAAIVALTLAAGTATAGQNLGGDVYYERAFVRAAQDKCRLFEPRLTQVVELRDVAGLSELEIAALLQRSERSVRRDWQKARLFLHAAMRED